ncbi:MAG: transposase [Eubacterium sp.]|nr:transposase [Eubacterium sp.]
MDNDIFNHIIARLISNADDAVAEVEANPDSEFEQGVQHAYYTALDTIRNELIIAEYDLKECGLEEDPMKMLYRSKTD